MCVLAPAAALSLAALLGLAVSRGLLLATPLVASTALFERRGFRYIFVTGGYWTLSFTLMGMLICAWG